MRNPLVRTSTAVRMSMTAVAEYKYANEIDKESADRYEKQALVLHFRRLKKSLIKRRVQCDREGRTRRHALHLDGFGEDEKGNK